MCRKKVLASQKIAKNSTINLAKKSSETILKYMKQCPYKSIFPKKILNKVKWGKNQEKGKKYCQEKCTNIALATFKTTLNSAQKSSLR